MNAQHRLKKKNFHGMFNEYMTNFCSMSEGGWLICTCVSQGHVWPQQQQQKGSPVLPLSFSSCLCTSTSVTPPMLPFHYTLTNTHLPPATGFCPPLHTGQLMAIGACAFGEATELQTYISSDTLGPPVSALWAQLWSSICQFTFCYRSPTTHPTRIGNLKIDK